MLFQKMRVSLNPSGLQQPPAVSQAEPAPCACPPSLQNTPVTCRPATPLCLLLTPMHTAQGHISCGGSMPEESKAARTVSVLPTDQSGQRLHTTSEGFHVLTGGAGRVQAPKQAVDSPKWTQGVAVSHRQTMIQSSSKRCHD